VTIADDNFRFSAVGTPVAEIYRQHCFLGRGRIIEAWTVGARQEFWRVLGVAPPPNV